ncbi:MAG TPA: sialate O-acetylesterase [Chitinophagaceae bacterium]
MVLQQNSTVTLWGWANPGETVTIRSSWDQTPVTAKAAADGKWTAGVKTSKAGGPYSISFIATDTITVKNVLLGEVWLASGQSNMEFFMSKTKNASYAGVIDYEKEIAAADYPAIRMIDVGNKTASEPQANFNGKWKICSPQTADTFSAVAFYFAREIHQATGYPIGIINATWGGTPAESWTKKEVLAADPDFAPILQRYQQQLDALPAAQEKYKADLQRWNDSGAERKGRAPRAPGNPLNNNKSPFLLYNGMIAPIVPFTLKGVIWYQGENNADRAFQYRKLFTAMIESWRSDWNNKDLPFYFVQISPHRSQNPEIRDAQLYVYRHTPHTGIAVTIDNGDSLNIHPRNKKLVGERLARWALYNDYDRKNIVYSGPLYKSYKISGNKIIISFDDTDGGLVAKDGLLKEFTIAGSDSTFVPAQAIIKGKTIMVWNDAIKKPVAVRFAWKNVPYPNLYNKADLPASPFRTDSFKLLTEGKN